ncbi:F-box/kelch-repeat protein At3g06240-like [Solanum tuberosum]|nr:PREDICTED: F-box/kelch-repeat protein At3g06240-like [Solanum tuberosum]
MAMSKAKYLPEELIIDIFYRLPVKSIGRSIDRENVQFLINPTTLEYHKFPVFDWALPPKTSCYMYGLGYDIVSDDYKVVSLSYRDTNNEFMSNTCVDLYSVRKSHWETLGISPYDHSLTDRASGVLVPGPIDLQDNCFMCNLATLKGCLCISTSLPRDINTVTFWIMKEYRVKESWTKFKIIEPSLDDSLSTLLCSITDDDDVLLDVDEEWVIYNLKENRRKDLLIDVNPITHEARTFVDSLVSPYFGNETEGSCIV